MAGSNLPLQCLFGMQCKDFAILAADQTNTQSIILMKNDENKLFPISEKLVMGVNGNAGDMAQFAQFVSKNLQLYRMRNGYPLDAAAAVHFTRKNLAESLRSGAPYILNLLIAGYDEDQGGQLYYMDYLASCVKVPFAVHGYGGLLSVGILGQNYSPDLTQSQAYEVLKTCVKEVNQRLIINLPRFQVCVIDKTGVKTLPPIYPPNVAV